MSKRVPFPKGHPEKTFEKSEGRCWYCGRKIAWSRRGDTQSPYGWHMEHLRPVSKGGHPTHLNNLVASCYSCNFEKGTKTSRTQLRRKGRTRGPLSRKERNERRALNGAGGAGFGAGVGSVFGPLGTLVGGSIGGGLGMAIPIKDPGVAEKKKCKAKTKAGKPCSNWAVPCNHGFCRVHR